MRYAALPKTEANRQQHGTLAWLRWHGLIERIFLNGPILQRGQRCAHCDPRPMADQADYLICGASKGSSNRAG
jgi:hypothetical protein